MKLTARHRCGGRLMDGSHDNLRPANDHRRSFARATLLAGLISISATAASAASAYFATSAARTGWSNTVVGLLGCAAFGALALYAVVTALGGLIVLYRDDREERGLPYGATGPRERTPLPCMGRLRALFGRRTRLGPGDWVEVRSLPEILRTLDGRGCLDGLPFMPEMATYCGHRFQVHRCVHKVWEYAHSTGLRRMKSAVLLKTLRCSGKSHGDCQAACQLIWKEAWLRPAGSTGPEDSATQYSVDLEACTHVEGANGRRYVCQMTEIVRATAQLPLRATAHYWRDLSSGNVRLGPLLVVLSIRLFNGLQWRLRGSLWPVLKPLGGNVTPYQDLGLQPGQWVRVKPKHAIEATLNEKLRNRGLEFGQDMLFCCGGSYRIAARVSRIVDERTGELLSLKMPSILLEGAHANGGTVLTPQNEYFFWREIWLEPEPSGEADRECAPVTNSVEHPR